MEITSCKNYTPNFQARLVAKTVNCIGKLETKIDLWEVSPQDSVVLNKIVEKTNMRELMPNVPYFENKRHQDMLAIAVDDTLLRGAKTYLAVADGNKPCGIMSIFKENNDLKTSCVCTWPVEIGKKVKFAGKTLFYQIFQDFKDSKAKKIVLEAIYDGPAPTVPWYESLGFRVADKNRLDTMVINQAKAKDACKRLSNRIDYTPVTEGKKVDLATVLDLD